MGSTSILVIGDDWRDQLDRYQSMEYAHPLSPHIVHINRLPDALKRYSRATSAMFRLPDGREVADFDEIPDEVMRKGVQLNIVRYPLNGAKPFAEWARSEYGVGSLSAGAEPDFTGDHRWGWIRMNDAGEVAELIERTIPGGFFFCFSGTCATFLLKPSATGWNIDSSGRVTEVTEGYVGSARLSDIDFLAMEQKRINDIQEQWDAVHRASAGVTWTSFAEIRKKYPPQTEQYDATIEHAANREWFDQPALKMIYEANCNNNYTPEALDLMLLPRATYAQHCTKRAGVLSFHDVICHGEHLISPDETELLAGLDSNVLLADAAVKC